MSTPKITKHWGTHTQGPWKIDLYAYEQGTPNLEGLAMVTDKRTSGHWYVDLRPGWRSDFSELKDLPKTATIAVQRASRVLTGTSIAGLAQ
jgi:hypothetical protein